MGETNEVILLYLYVLLWQFAYLSTYHLARGMHPIDFFQALSMKAAMVVTKEINNQRIWAANPTCAAAELVPFAVDRAKELSAAARSVQVTQVGINQYVCQYYEAGAIAAHVRRTVNIGMGTCSCLEYQRYRFPCKDVFAGSLCGCCFGMQKYLRPSFHILQRFKQHRVKVG